MVKILLYLKSDSQGSCPDDKGNPFPLPASFERDKLNGLKMKEIVLTQGKVALVDDEDYEYLNQWKWRTTKSRKKYYASRASYVSGKRKTIFMHRVIMNTPVGMETDHIDGNELNNVRSNLRIVTSRQNKLNVKPYANRKYVGVYIYHKKGHSYIKASIHHNGRNISLGNYPSEEEAALAYNEAALKYRGEYAYLNVVKTIEI